jgi:hypothetical protein
MTPSPRLRLRQRTPNPAPRARIVDRDSPSLPSASPTRNLLASCQDGPIRPCANAHFIVVGARFVEHLPCLALAEAHGCENLKHLGENLRAGRVRLGRPVAVAVGMAEREAPGVRARHDEAPVVHRPVVRGAQRHHPLRVVSTTLGAQLDVVHVHEGAVAAARDRAAVMMPPEHGSPNPRRNGLRSRSGTGASTRPTCCPSHSAMATVARSTTTGSAG